MPAGTLHLKADQGANFIRIFFVTERDENGVLVPVSIVGNFFKMQVRKHPEYTVVLEASTANGKIVRLDDPNGKYQVEFDNSDLDNLDYGDYKYDIFRTDNTGVVFKELEGNFNIDSRITK
jgi:hypothetical protein